MLPLIVVVVVPPPPTTTNDNEGSSSGKNELITIKDQFVPIESIFVSKITNSID